MGISKNLILSPHPCLHFRFGRQVWFFSNWRRRSGVFRDALITIFCLFVAVNWIDKLQQRWKVRSTFQVIIILMVFACTGFTIFFLKRPVFSYLFGDDPMPLWASVVYYVLILPVYNVFLLIYGFLFGQFRFFWDFEKRFFGRIFGKKSNTYEK